MKRLIITVFSFFLLACEPVTSYEPESKPDKVPSTAIWIGGADGGVYAVVNISESKYFGTVYFEHNGDVWYDGGFTYTGKKPFNVTDKSLYSSWDGDILHLVNGEQLIANIMP